MTTFSKKISQSWLLVMMIITTLTFTSCKKDENVPPPPVWHNTFTPPLENNNQRDSVYDDENITFSTHNPASGIYIWSWGDGSKNDTTETIYAIHRFQRLGLNIVKLRVERGNTYGENTDSIWVFHRDIPPCGFRIDGQDSLYIQHASQFVANINTPDCNSTCSFEYQWDFGDGNTGTGYSISHIYADNRYLLSESKD
ncbi:MAG: PKD domain-containing protein [Saprospiraceae bacterium]|nr:PKD domain-containing protein [Saprospiraceae bacterium]